MSKIIIVCACDNKYAGYCGVMITSVFANNTRHQIEVNILTDGIDDVNREKMQTIARHYGQTIQIVQVDKEQFRNLPIGNFTHISLCTYYRLLMPELFKDPKVLYLDCDIIVRGDLDELWSTDLTGMAMAALPDNTYMIHSGIKRLGYAAEDSYHNAGVSLYNLDFMRSFHFGEKVKSFIEEHRDRIKFHDQDVLNAVCHGYYKDISVKWNMMEGFLKEMPRIRKDYMQDLDQWIASPSIIHYAASVKPWHKECKHIYRAEYEKYKRLSPWADMPAVSNYKCKADKVKAELKLMLLKIRDFRELKRYRFKKLQLEEKNGQV